MIGVCLIFIFYELYLFIFFDIGRSLTHYILLIYFSKLLRLRFFTYYTLITYFSKLLRLRFLMHYTLITYFSKPVEPEIFNTLHSVYLFF